MVDSPYLPDITPSQIYEIMEGCWDGGGIVWVELDKEYVKVFPGARERIALSDDGSVLLFEDDDGEDVKYIDISDHNIGFSPRDGEPKFIRGPRIN